MVLVSDIRERSVMLRSDGRRRTQARGHEQDWVGTFVAHEKRRRKTGPTGQGRLCPAKGAQEDMYTSPRAFAYSLLRVAPDEASLGGGSACS
jgi:hypothetical protein